MSEVDPYKLILDINDVPRDLAPVDGNQQVSDLSGFPRIRVEGETTLSVSNEFQHANLMYNQSLSSFSLSYCRTKVHYFFM